MHALKFLRVKILLWVIDAFENPLGGILVQFLKTKSGLIRIYMAIFLITISPHRAEGNLCYIEIANFWINVKRFQPALWRWLVAAKTAREIHVRVSNNRFLSVRYLVFNEWPNARIWVANQHFCFPYVVRTGMIAIHTAVNM